MKNILLIEKWLNKHLKKRVDTLKNLELSKVAETDRESSIDISPNNKKNILLKNNRDDNSKKNVSIKFAKASGLRRNKSTFKVNDLILSDAKLIGKQNTVLNNERENNSTKITPNKNGIIRNSRRVDSTPNLKTISIYSGSNPISSQLTNELPKRLYLDENSLMNSQKIEGFNRLKIQT